MNEELGLGLVRIVIGALGGAVIGIIAHAIVDGIRRWRKGYISLGEFIMGEFILAMFLVAACAVFVLGITIGT